MFGDVGHGLLLFTLGIWLMFSHDPLKHSQDVLYKCRYIFSLMGFFATFCGLIYGDFVSLPVWFFGSCYDKKVEKHLERADPDCVVVFGLDPVWLDSPNNL
jgi:V-type H+-transporting ATPase subunit a